jgi:glycosyltransferase involved in cell wall biosynthesis
VIIPAFNAAEYIRETLHAVLAQTYRALEVIVVDDGSADATGSIVKEFVKKDARVHLVRQCNAGVGAARNTAIRMARGEYIASMDADDVWFRQKLEKQVACMELYGEETGLVYCWSIRVDNNGAFDGFQFLNAAEGRLRDAMVSRNRIDNASVPLFRASALASVGPYLTRDEQGGAQGCEDWDLYIRIAETFCIRLVPKFLVAYRRTGSSMSVNVESMAASYAVIMQRARQRNPDLPAATFRCAAGGFYKYLSNVSERWAAPTSWSFLYYLTKALCADPSNLLTTWTLRKLIMAIPGSTWKKFVKQVWRSFKNRQGADLRYGKEYERWLISDAMSKQIERSRWPALLGQD